MDRSPSSAEPPIVPGSTTSELIDEAIALAYQELRAIAHHRLSAAGRGGTLTTTALVHEAYLKLVDGQHARRFGRAHLLAAASLAMRHVLVDRARERATLKRDGARQRITLDDVALTVDAEPEALLALDEAMDRLAAFEPRLARVVECRFFGGLTESETAEALGLTARTVQRDWVKARVLLRRALED